MFDQNAERDWLEKLEKTHPSSILDLASDRALLPKLWLALAKVPGSPSKYIYRTRAIITRGLYYFYPSFLFN